MRITITRRFEFAAGHRVMNHESVCRNVHGHNYTAEITFASANLDQLGRVLDFGEIKRLVGGGIEAELDHAFIAFSEDKEVIAALGNIAGQRIVHLPLNPTAENMAFHMLHHSCPKWLKDTPCRAVKVVLHETANCRAEVSL